MDLARAQNPSISVIIPHLDQVDGLSACLSSLQAQTLDSSLFEVIVVDNGSTCRPEAVTALFSGVRLLYELEPGPGPARNLGVKHAAGDIFCFIDADCRAHPHWLSAILDAFSRLPRGTILGGDVQIWRQNPEKWGAIEAYESIFGYRQKLHVEYYGFSGSGNLAVRSEDFHKVGPFGGILLAEDKDWGARARARGLVFRYIPQMIVFHPARPSLRLLCVQWDRLIQHTLTATRQHKSWRLLWLGRAVAVFGSPLFDIGEILTSDRIDGFLARVRAFGILIVIRWYRAWRMLTLLAWSNRGVVWNRNTPVSVAKE
ncbi:glycosyltransferase family 2 protein [Bradyrhizobium sp. SBR1B]|uniref:glycosyltransferase n=1 Tax=Bradyrhizobium sp. SBR1B TaxID=2663836 RepID=UPI001605E0C5|nr:glycosyltransferase [Bradyrhizobium sp. SBR1B]MBB4382508.1 glycosyltransferase involved in cell wall biosynthesis [Bradyrhizobium sp. SBR1B]